MLGLQELDKDTDTGDPMADHQMQFKVTIFSAPAPFEGIVGNQQAVAIDSWLRLSPCLKVVLLGKHLSLQNFASRRTPNVTVDTDIDVAYVSPLDFVYQVSRQTHLLLRTAEQLCFGPL
jgi:hypothetical protein